MDAFTNNAADDFMDLMYQNPTWEVTRDAFSTVITYPDELEYDDGAYVLVAAALIAFQAVGEPEIPAPAKALVGSLGPAPDDLADIAKAAFRIAIADQTKLAEKWLDAGQLSVWKSNMAKLGAAIERS